MFKNKEMVLHKLGHTVFYSLLTLLVYYNFPNLKRRAVFVLITLFAVSDEIHQCFVVGRDGRAYDVLLDVTVSLVTLLVLRYTRGRVTTRF